MFTLVEETLQTVFGRTLDTTVFKDLLLPTKLASAEVPTLGLGLTFAVTINPSAFLASAASSNSLVGSMLGITCWTAVIAY